jgi:hypothetical protein
MSGIANPEFSGAYGDDLRVYWDGLKERLGDLRSRYEWPPGRTADASVNARAELEGRIRAELDHSGCLSKATFDAVILWGFGAISGCSEDEIRNATRGAFHSLERAGIAAAARELTALPRIGISRASKILALSNQHEFGIYDSRSAHGLSDFVDGTGRRHICIPPGRVITGDAKTTNQYCDAFEHYIRVLRLFREIAAQDTRFANVFSRVSDVEMAFFMRSRAGDLPLSNPSLTVAQDLHTKSDLNEEDEFWTLGPGKKSRRFFAIIDASTITVLTGELMNPFTLRQQDVQDCLRHFSDREFPLSNSKTSSNRDPAGLGEYFARKFGSSVYASHFAALWVREGRLVPIRRDGEWWFQLAQRPRGPGSQ